MNPFPMVSAWNLHIMFPLKQVHKSGGGGGGGGEAQVRRGCGRGYTAIGCEAEPQQLRVVVLKI